MNSLVFGYLKLEIKKENLILVPQLYIVSWLGPRTTNFIKILKMM
jgi:hypothetical protein